MHGNIMTTDLGEEVYEVTLSEHFAADEDAQAEERREDLAAIGATARAYPRWLAIYCSAYADDAVHERRSEWK